MQGALTRHVGRDLVFNLFDCDEAGVGDCLEAREPLQMFERERVLIVKEVLTARRADENALAVIFHKNGAHVVVRTRIG